MFLYDTHVHTNKVSACADCTPSEQVWEYKRQGYSGVIITDHFINGNTHSVRHLPWEKKMDFIYSGYKAAKEVGDECDFDVFFGWEYAIGGSDILTYGLDIDFLYVNPDLTNLGIKEYSKRIRQHGGFLVQAHPYRKAEWIRKPFPHNAKFLDGIEVFNAANTNAENRQAYVFAKENNLAMSAGTDSHRVDGQKKSGLALKQRAGSIFDIIDALKENTAKLILPSETYFI